MKMNKENQIKATSEAKSLKVMAIVISCIFVVLMLYPFVFTIGNSMKESTKIYAIPPKILPDMSKTMSISLDYSQHEGKSEDEIKDMLLQDSTTLLFGLSKDLSKENIYEYELYAHMNGTPIYYSRVHQNLIQLEKDYGVYAGTVMKQNVLLLKDKYKEVMENITYEFDVDGIDDSINVESYTDEFQSQVNDIIVEDFTLFGEFETASVDDNVFLLLETFKYYLQMPQYAFTSSPAIQQFGFGVFAMNTAIVIGFAVISQVILCSICAFVISRMLSRKAGSYMILFFMGAMMIPTASIITPLILMMTEIGAFNTYWALLLPFLYPTGFFVYLYKGFFDQIPGSYFEAAKLDGATNMYLYSKICMPLSKPIVALIALQTFIGNWNDYFWASLVTQDQNLWTLNVALFNISNANGTKQNAILGLAIITITPVIIASIIFSKQLKESIMAAGVKG